MNKDTEISFLVVGLGSIGRRHLVNLSRLGYTRLMAVTRNTHPLPKDDLPPHRAFGSLAEGLLHRPAAVIVANPTALHLSTALAAAEAGCHIFMEKPIAHELEGLKELERLIRDRRLIFQTGFQFRYHPTLLQIKKLLEGDAIGKPISAEVHWGEYLPGWHPYEDYRQGYSARKDMGGGVVLTLCHPFDYLRWLLGEVQEVTAMIGHQSALEIDTEDLALSILRFRSGPIASVYLDYVEKPARHSLHIIGEKGKVEWNNTDGKACLYNGSGELAQQYSPPEGFERNDLFVAEMEEFTACIEAGRAPRCDFTDGLQALRIALAVKEAAEQRMVLPLASGLISPL